MDERSSSRATWWRLLTETEVEEQREWVRSGRPFPPRIPRRLHAQMTASEYEEAVFTPMLREVRAMAEASLKPVPGETITIERARDILTDAAESAARDLEDAVVQTDRGAPQREIHEKPTLTKLGSVLVNRRWKELHEAIATGMRAVLRCVDSERSAKSDLEQELRSMRRQAVLDSCGIETAFDLPEDESALLLLRDAELAAEATCSPLWLIEAGKWRHVDGTDARPAGRAETGDAWRVFECLNGWGGTFNVGPEQVASRAPHIISVLLRIAHRDEAHASASRSDEIHTNRSAPTGPAEAMTEHTHASLKRLIQASGDPKAHWGRDWIRQIAREAGIPAFKRNQTFTVRQWHALIEVLKKRECVVAAKKMEGELPLRDEFSSTNRRTT